MTRIESRKTPQGGFWDSVSNYSLVVGGMVHDLNNSLAPIQGYSEIFEQRILTMDLPEEVRMEFLEYSVTIRRSANQVRAIAKSLLAISQPFYKKGNNAVLHTDIEKSVAVVPRSYVCEGTKLAVRFYVRRPIPVLALPRPIFDLIINELVHNSLRAAKRVERDATLSVTLSYFCDDHLLRIVAKDTGPGFAEETCENRPAEVPGTGLFFLTEISNRLDGWLFRRNDPRGGARVEIGLVAGEVRE